LMLSLAEGSRGGSNRSHKRVAIDAYLWAEGVDGLCAEFKSKGANVTLEPTDRFYGLREIEVTDPDGYVLCFGAPLQRQA
ncbi:MAG: VOC family protein, partial [Candidatus Binataceae bacterium]